ncbi:MAG: hypothetical protein M9921_11605 [Fimbriimonadaceae bacterium]|nr:hypothetical protein [Fimbriimonadaceae bacterium]
MMDLAGTSTRSSDGPNGIDFDIFTRGCYHQYDYSGLLDPDVSIDTDLLYKITDPRGLETIIHYCEGNSPVTPYNTAIPAVFCYKIAHPSGMFSYFKNSTTACPEGPYSSTYYSVGPPEFQDGFGEGENYVMVSICEVMTSAASEQAPLVYQRISDPLPPSGAAPCKYSERYVNPFTHDLLESVTYRPTATEGPTLNTSRLQACCRERQLSAADSAYNFLGMPLLQETSEWSYGEQNPERTTRTEIAYWGADKYFQRKASVTTWPNTSEPAVISFTDYYDDQASTGKGLPHLVYDSVNATFSNSSGTGWRDAIAVSGGDETASFQYDSLGRPTHIHKISKDGGSNDFIETATSYGSLGSPYWGAAIEVDEDVQGANRVTSTLEYDSMGRAVEVEDAAGHVFVTTYLDDGEVSEVTVDDDPVVSYTYGSGTATGQPTLIEDGLPRGGRASRTARTASGRGSWGCWSGPQKARMVSPRSTRPPISTM